MKAFQRIASVAATGLVLTLAACSPPRFDDGVSVEEPVPDSAVVEAPTEPAETPLLGGPPGSERLPPPPPPFPPPPPPLPPPPADEFFEMAPIPNPGDEDEPPLRPRREPRPRAEVRPERRPAARGARPAEPRPAPKAQPRPAPAQKSAPAPAAKAPAPKPKPKPVEPQKAPPPAPAPKPQPQPKPKPAPEPITAPAPMTPVERLSEHLAMEVGASRLQLPETLASGYQGVVTLTLPPNFPERLAAEAAKEGLSKEASVADARAVLKGGGYGVSPSEPQTVRIKPGPPISFTWMVAKPQGDLAKARAADDGPLRAVVSVDLKGGGESLSAPLAVIEAEDESAKAATPRGPGAWRNFGLTIPLILILIAIFFFIRWLRARGDEERKIRKARSDAFHR